MEPVEFTRQPLDRVFALDSDRFGGPLTIALAGAVAVHVLGAAQAYAISDSTKRWARDLRQNVHVALTSQYEVDILKAPPPAPPPPEPEKEEAPTPAPPTRVAAPVAKTANAPPPAAAQAGKILTQTPDDAPVDLTGEGFVTGNAESYAGGVTASNGTSAGPVRSPMAAATGVPGGVGKPSDHPVAGPDLTRPAGPGKTEWDCPFPPESDEAQINLERVHVVVTVRPDGTPQSVRVLADPGHGFGRAARECAMRQRFEPALDRDGKPVASTSPPFWIKFSR